MNEKDWLILRAVYQHKNITRAAEQLYTSQPALSYRLRQIESKLAIRLKKDKKDRFSARRGNISRNTR
ncbi:HTH-type transcriptional regulator HdfR [Rahnella aquatilis]|nr:HTH-type transcriptional regulator HdfR [Rahnella aquatilis]